MKCCFSDGNSEPYSPCSNNGSNYDVVDMDLSSCGSQDDDEIEDNRDCKSNNARYDSNQEEDEDDNIPYSPSQWLIEDIHSSIVDKILRSPEKFELKKRIADWVADSEVIRKRCNDDHQAVKVHYFHGRQFVLQPRGIPHRMSNGCHFMEDPRVSVYITRFRKQLKRVTLHLWRIKYCNRFIEEQVIRDLKNVVERYGSHQFWQRLILFTNQPILYMSQLGKISSLTPILGAILDVSADDLPKLIPDNESKTSKVNDPRLIKGELYCQNYKLNTSLQVLPYSMRMQK
ncbi:hypothetical protein GJ496_004520 [Pomphorhynchus laevis]|nr:hypothetical protein GJ496_004520 [Pomphorhynchus laevis]